MLKRRNVLPPLDYLVAFEAAGELGSFARASKQLNISETAISRKVRLLEQHYGQPLFVRGHRSVTLTTQGTTLLAAVGRSLDQLRDASADMLARQQVNAVTLAATNSVASLWLMPRLRRFNRSNAHVKITLMSSDSDEECLADDMDLTILRGDGDWPGYDARLLFGETIFPVCSPDYLRRNPGAARLDSYGDLDLIEVSSRHPEWMTWKTWLRHQGADEQWDGAMLRADRFNTYPLGVQAAVDGLGLALGWGHLVDPLLESGQLVRPLGTLAVRTASGYYLLTKKEKPDFPEGRIVSDWLLKVSAARKRYGAAPGRGQTLR